MAISAGDVEIKVVVDASDADKSVKEITGGLDDVRKASKICGQGLRKDLDKSLKITRKSMGSLGEAAGDGDSVLQGFSAALDMVSPGLGNVARSGGDALAAVESLGRSFTFANPLFLGLAAGAAVLGAAFVLLSEDEEETIDFTEQLTEANINLAESMEMLDGVQSDLHERLLLSNGDLTEQELALAQVVSKVMDEYAPALDDVAESLRLEKQLLEDLRGETHYNLEDRKKNIELIAIQEEAVRSLGEEETRIRNEQQKARREEQEIINDTYERKAAEEALAKAEKEAEKARKTAEANARKRSAAEKARGKDLKAAEELAAKLAEDKLTDAEKIHAAYDKQIEKLDELIEKYPADSEMYATAQATKTEADARRDRDLVALEEKNNADAAAQAEKEEKALAAAWQLSTDNAKKTAETDAQVIADRASAVSQGQAEIAQASADAFALMLENEKIASSDAAQYLFKLQKAAALANIVIKTQEGLVTAASLPPPADAWKAAAVYASAAVAAATVLATPAPTFHSGGVVRAPDEVGITAQTGEGVVNRIGMSRLGEQGLAEINAGGGTSGGVIVNQWKHRIYQDFVRDELSQTGSPLRKAIKKGSRVGQL